LKQNGTTKVLIEVDGTEKLVAAASVKAKLLLETGLLQPTEQGESHSVYRSTDTLKMKSLTNAQRTKMQIPKNKLNTWPCLEEQDISQPQHAQQIQQVLDISGRDVKVLRQQVLIGTWLGNAALRAIAASVQEECHLVSKRGRRWKK
jgi:hypothetical protein